MSFKSTVSKSIREAILSPALDAVVSSANMVSVEFSFKKQRSLMKMIKSSGPRIEPWVHQLLLTFYLIMSLQIKSLRLCLKGNFVLN